MQHVVVFSVQDVSSIAIIHKDWNSLIYFWKKNGWNAAVYCRMLAQYVIANFIIWIWFSSVLDSHVQENALADIQKKEFAYISTFHNNFWSFV
jgi:hypothetical protein